MQSICAFTMRDLFLWTRSYSQVPCRLPYFISTLGTHAYTTWTVLTLFSLLKPGILPWFSHRWKHFGSLRFLQLDMSFEAVENILLKCYSGGVFSALMENIITSRKKKRRGKYYLSLQCEDLGAQIWMTLGPGQLSIRVKCSSQNVLLILCF